MVGQQQFDDGLARAHERARRVRLDLHALGHRERAARRPGSRWPSTSTTHIRQAPLGGSPPVAQRRDLDARRGRGAVSTVSPRCLRSIVSCPLTSRSLTDTVLLRLIGQDCLPGGRQSRRTAPQPMHRSESRWSGRLGRADDRLRRAVAWRRGCSPCTVLGDRCRNAAARAGARRAARARRRAPRTRRGTSAACCSTGLGAVWPRPHRLVSRMASARCSRCITPLEPLERVDWLLARAGAG